MITKVISGGQHGADIAGLKAAKQLGLETGGTMCYGWLTIKGTRPEYKEDYGMVECNNKGYPARTEKNVLNSDGTVRFAFDFNSPGEKCTLRYLNEHNKPYFDVDLNNPPPISSFQEWLRRENISVLNVAGNADTTNKVESLVMDYLLVSLGGNKATAIKDDEVPF